MDFANYAFNKAHAVCYAVVAYQTAYLKYHFPKEYMAALLTSVLGQNAKVAEYIEQCRELGVTVLPPDVNESGSDFTVAGNNIRFGLGSVKNVGVGLIEKLVAERKANGRFADFYDFCQRMSAQELNRRALEGLIRCGAFDSMGARRSQLLRVFDSVLESAQSDLRRNVEGQLDLFGGLSENETPRAKLPDIPEFSRQELLRMERETCGLYLSGHPMDELRPLAKQAGALPIARLSGEGDEELGGSYDGETVTLAGVISAVRQKLTKKQTTIAYVTLEDTSGSVELMIFEKNLAAAAPYLQPEMAVLARGRVSAREDEEPKLLCDQLYPLNPEGLARMAQERQPRSFRRGGARRPEPSAAPEPSQPSGKELWIKLADLPDARTALTRDILAQHPGRDRAVVYLLHQRQKMAWQKGVDAPGAFDALLPAIGKENLALKDSKEEQHG